MTPNNPPKTLLFIDDEQVCHTLINLIIPMYTDLKPASVYNGQAALDYIKLNSKDIAIILSDIMLPDISGIDIYNALRANKDLHDIPFIFQSGLGSQTNKLISQINDDKTYLLYKPYRQQELLEAINRFR